MLAECKALSNETRLAILEWLKDPATWFPEATPGPGAAPGAEAGAGADTWSGDTASAGAGSEIGICAGLIQRRAGCSASTVSAHLAVLQRAGFLIATRRGQWIYFRRDEERIRAFAERLHRDL